MDLTNVPDNLKKAVQVRHANSPLAHRDQKQLCDEIIEKVLEDGATLSNIAAEYGVSRVRLSQILLEHAPKQWQSAHAARELSKLEQSAEELETAPDMLSVNRARDRAKLAHWALERSARALYGQEQTVQVNINLRSAEQEIQAIEQELGISSSIIEHEPAKPE